MRYFECFYDYNGSCVAGKSTIILLNPKEEKYFKILLGILNSKLISFFIRGSYSTLGIDGGINFSRDMVEGLPLPSSIKSGGNQIISLVDKIIECKRINKSSDTSSIETEIDNIVYKLYGMKNEEISIIENSFKKENG